MCFSFVHFILILLSIFEILKCQKSPNIILILTDDQDLTLGGMIPMGRTKDLIAGNGAEFNNMFVTTPLCCPSRASILTGKYAHNHGVRNNSLNGNCNSKYWQDIYEKRTFITYLKNADYSTFYAGKYLNQYGTLASGGVQHVPHGWDHWIGLVGNSCYYNYSLSINGKKVYHGSDSKKDYLTNIVFSEAKKFIQVQNKSSPFFMFLSPPAPHAPFLPFPTYKNKFSSLKAPRTPNFAYPGFEKHWLLQQPPKQLPKYVIDSIDEVFRNRWRTLLSVDDNIYEMFQQLEKEKLLENTFIFFTSDNGFHLGQFLLPWDKRQPYEFDIRVPLLVRGPGVKAGLKIKDPVLNIDLAPTFLELANVLPTNREFDGKSFAAFLKGEGFSATTRSSFIVEHQGEYSEMPIKDCPQYNVGEVHTCEIDCICEDSWNNTYTCVRHLSNLGNFILCLFKDKENFGEAYNLSEDPYELKNIFNSFNKSSFTDTFKTLYHA